MLTAAPWKGLRLAVADNFDGGSLVELSTTGDWTKFNGTGSIFENGTGTALSSSVGATATAWYKNIKGSFIGNRWVRSYVRAVGNGCKAGLFTTANATKTCTAVYVQHNLAGARDDFYIYEDYGVPSTQYLGNLPGNGTERLFLLRRVGTTLFYDFDSGSLSGSVGCSGSLPSVPTGLYYVGPAFGIGTQATWREFLTRLYAYK